MSVSISIHSGTNGDKGMTFTTTSERGPLTSDGPVRPHHPHPCRVSPGCAPPHPCWVIVALHLLRCQTGWCCGGGRRWQRFGICQRRGGSSAGYELGGCGSHAWPTSRARSRAQPPGCALRCRLCTPTPGRPSCADIPSRLLLEIQHQMEAQSSI
jgi:hypothetical protein